MSLPEASSELDTQLDFKQAPIYWSAFHPHLLTVGLVITAAYLGRNDDPVGWGIRAAILSGVIWVAAVLYVNKTYQEKLDVFNSDAAAIARGMFGSAGEETNAFIIEHGHDSVWFLQPYRVIEPVTVIVGDTSMLVYDDYKLELDRLSANFGTSTREFYYDSIASVNYDEPYFEIKLADGDFAQYRSSRKPDSVLYELQNRVRQYKTQ
jgi:hypothetical protein